MKDRVAFPPKRVSAALTFAAVQAEGNSVPRHRPSPMDRAVVHCRTESDVNDRLDEAKIEQLRAWGAGLSADGDYELRAAGKAILLLIEEIERLHIDVWSAKAIQEEDRPDRADADDQLEVSLERTLRSTLSRVRRRTSKSAVTE